MIHTPPHPIPPLPPHLFSVFLGPIHIPRAVKTDNINRFCWSAVWTILFPWSTRETAVKIKTGNARDRIWNQRKLNENWGSRNVYGVIPGIRRIRRCCILTYSWLKSRWYFWVLIRGELYLLRSQHPTAGVVHRRRSCGGISNSGCSRSSTSCGGNSSYILTAC